MRKFLPLPGAPTKAAGSLQDYLRRRTNISQWVPRGGLGFFNENAAHLARLAKGVLQFGEKSSRAAVPRTSSDIETKYDRVLRQSSLMNYSCGGPMNLYDANPTPLFSAARNRSRSTNVEAMRWPLLSVADEQAVLKVLRDGDLSLHPVTRELEAMIIATTSERGMRWPL